MLAYSYAHSHKVVWEPQTTAFKELDFWSKYFLNNIKREGEVEKLATRIFRYITQHEDNNADSHYNSKMAFWDSLQDDGHYNSMDDTQGSNHLQELEWRYHSDHRDRRNNKLASRAPPAETLEVSKGDNTLHNESLLYMDTNQKPMTQANNLLYKPTTCTYEWTCTYDWWIMVPIWHWLEGTC